ncbi:VOC family protein [Flaviflexus sp.]|uniref:VOC family protein n=1 Tax=Flaviflexus sp. TaxID=1969482 RepID=UPI003F8E9B95
MTDNSVGVPPLLDHIVVAAPDLEAVVADFERATGVRPVKGGSHERFGTRNYLISFGGDAYMEFVGIDPELPEPSVPRPFNLDDLADPVVSTWVLHPEDPDAAVESIRAAGIDVGDLSAASRLKPDGELLTWRLTPLLQGGLNGVIPFLIDWEDSVSPAHSVEPRATLQSFVIHTNDPDALGGYLAALGTGVDMCCRGDECPSGKCQGELPCLGLAVSGPEGTWTL